jgi:hypothetical protein
MVFATGARLYEITNNTVTYQNWKIISASEESPSLEEWRYLICFDMNTSFHSHICSVDSRKVKERPSLYVISEL